jgi:hypothetical protein
MNFRRKKKKLQKQNGKLSRKAMKMAKKKMMEEK